MLKVIGFHHSSRSLDRTSPRPSGTPLHQQQVERGLWRQRDQPMATGPSPSVVDGEGCPKGGVRLSTRSRIYGQDYLAQLPPRRNGPAVDDLLAAVQVHLLVHVNHHADV